MRITDSIIIDRPIEEVFAYAGDPSNDPVWSTAFLDTRITSDGPLAKGSTLIQEMRFLGKRIEIDCEVTEYEPGRRVAYNMAVGHNKGAHVRTFESVEGGTEFTLLTEGDAGGLFKVAEPVLNKVGTRQLGADLHALKAMLESTE